MAEAIRVTMFGGIVPRLADRGLPDNAAQFALNAKLYSGELRAWSQLRPLANLPISNAKTVYHYRHNGSDHYLAFPEHTHVVKAPLVNETLGRLYWAGSTGPYVNTTTRILASQPAYRLGVPAPGGVFSVVPSGGTAATAESRAYVAIWVSAFGEEGAPAAPVLVNGNADGSWTVNGLNALTADAAYTNITHLRLYRTVTSATGVDYRQVAEWPIGARPASYVDNVATSTVASAAVLQSLTWTPPPTNLKGLIAVAGGFMAGFSGRTVHLSVPYYPHAWPEEYQIAVEDNIVGLGTFGNTIVVATEGRTYLLVGQVPEVMASMKMEGVQPCLSARGIVSTVGGVMYPATDGLVLVDGGSNRGQIVSRGWVTKDEWDQFNPAGQMASVYQDRYLAFYGPQLGFTIGFDDPVTGFTELQLEGVQSVDLDPLTGQTLITIGDTVYEWDGDPLTSLAYSWRSKPFLQNRPVNFGAIQLRGAFVGSSVGVDLPPAQGLGGYALNQQVVNGGKSTGNRYGGSLNGPSLWMALGAEPAPPQAGPEVAVKVYGDGVLRWFGAISDEDIHRLPSGFKCVLWEVEVQGVSPLFSIALADTPKTLRNVP